MAEYLIFFVPFHLTFPAFNFNIYMTNDSKNRCIVLILLIKKHITLLSVIISAGLILLCACFLSGVYRGRVFRSDSVVTSEVNAENADNAPAALRECGIENIDLPKNYTSINRNIISVSTTTCKKYTEAHIVTNTGEIIAREYNYAYLVEDEQVIIAQYAEKITDGLNDIYISDNHDGTCTAVYYSGLTLYHITERCSIEEARTIFA